MTKANYSVQYGIPGHPAPDVESGDLLLLAVNLLVVLVSSSSSSPGTHGVQLHFSFQLCCHPCLVPMNSVTTTDHQPFLLCSHSGQLPYSGPPYFLRDCSIPQMLEFLTHFFPIPSYLIITMIFPEQRSDYISHLISSLAPAVLCVPLSVSTLPFTGFLAFSALSTSTAHEMLFFFFKLLSSF